MTDFKCQTFKIISIIIIINIIFKYFPYFFLVLINWPEKKSNTKRFNKKKPGLKNKSCYGDLYCYCRFYYQNKGKEIKQLFYFPLWTCYWNNETG